MTINIFFDLDMTLIYRNIMWVGTVRELLLEECVVVKESDIRPFNIGYGYPWNKPELSQQEFLKGKGFWEHIEDYIVEGLLEKNLAKKDVARRVASKFRDRFLDRKYWSVFNDTIPTIKALKDKGYKVHIISNNVPECREIIDFLGLTKFFDSFTLSYEIGYQKPNPIIFKKALEGHENQINIMVGDNYNADILGALGVGIPAIMVRKYNEHNYKYYLKDFKNLDRMIDEVIKREIRQIP